MNPFQPQGMQFIAMPLSKLGDGFMAAAFGLWQQWCGDRPAPAWVDIELFMLPPPVLPYVTVVDVIDGGADFKYRFWGTGLTDLFGYDETGNTLSGCRLPHSQVLRFSQFRPVVDDCRPYLFLTLFEQVEGIVAEKFNLRLPIVDKPGEVTKIITFSEIRRIELTESIDPPPENDSGSDDPD